MPLYCSPDSFGHDLLSGSTRLLPAAGDTQQHLPLARNFQWVRISSTGLSFSATAGSSREAVIHCRHANCGASEHFPDRQDLNCRDRAYERLDRSRAQSFPPHTFGRFMRADHDCDRGRIVCPLPLALQGADQIAYHSGAQVSPRLNRDDAPAVSCPVGKKEECAVNPSVFAVTPGMHRPDPIYRPFLEFERICFCEPVRTIEGGWHAKCVIADAWE